MTSEERSPRGRPLSLCGHQGRQGRCCGRAGTRRDGGPRGAGGLTEMGRVLGVVVEVSDLGRRLKLPTERRIGGCQRRAGRGYIFKEPVYTGESSGDTKSL